VIQFKPLISLNRETIKEIESALNITLDVEINNTSSDKVFVVQEGNQILGCCLFETLTTEYTLLKQVYINPKERKQKLGDALFRAVLNSIELNGGKHVSAYGNDEEISFYLHEGMKRISDEDARTYNWNISIGKYQPTIFLPSIADFFNTPCKGHKHSKSL